MLLFVAFSPLSLSLSFLVYVRCILVSHFCSNDDRLTVLCAASPFDHHSLTFAHLRLPALSVPKLLQMRKFAQAREALWVLNHPWLTWSKTPHSATWRLIPWLQRLIFCCWDVSEKPIGFYPHPKALFEKALVWCQVLIDSYLNLKPQMLNHWTIVCCLLFIVDWWFVVVVVVVVVARSWTVTPHHRAASPTSAGGFPTPPQHQIYGWLRKSDTS